MFFVSNSKTLDTFMPRQLSEPFFSKHPVFRRNEYAAAVGRHPMDKTVTAMLSHHLRAGNVKRVGRGVFATVPKFADAQKWVVDRFLAASRLRQNGVIAYHSALELLGYAYTEGHVVQVISEQEPGLVEADIVACRFVRPPKGIALHSDPWNNGITTVSRLGQDISVTTIEQTIAHLFDRYDLAGGTEELFNSLDFVDTVDVASLIGHARACGNSAAIGALGFWLERERDFLNVPDSAIEDLRRLAPPQVRYALGTKPGNGKIAKGWNVILPLDVIEPRFEGL